MNTLIVTLPGKFADAVPLCQYFVTSDGKTTSTQGSAAIENLPFDKKGTHKVAVVVPAEMLSWQKVKLPPGINSKSARLRTVLEGILEERLLDAPELIHFAIEPGSLGKNSIWVAACERTWLKTHTHSLEKAGYPVSVILPEFEPTEAAMQVHFSGDITEAKMAICGPHGVTLLPAIASSVKLAQQYGSPAKDMEVFAAADLVELATTLWGTKVNITTPEQRSLSPLKSSWNLAQFDIASSSGSRRWKRVEEGFDKLVLDRQWRGLRWGLSMLLLVNITGLNAWAWKEKSLLDAKQSLVNEVFVKTFPRVTPVIDPVLQMEREVAALRRSAGILSGTDLEAMLGSLAAEVPSGRIPGNIDFASQELKAKGLVLTSDEVAQLKSKLQRRGYLAQTDGDLLTMKVEAGK
ncbi:MAG: type II secretion system protein GspL [Pseudomonadota bacterium]